MDDNSLPPPPPQPPVSTLVSIKCDERNIEEIKNTFARDGAIILEDMLSQEVVESLLNDFEASGADLIAPGSLSQLEPVIKFWGANTKRFTQLSRRSTTFLEQVLTHTIYHKIVAANLSDSYWMNTGQAMFIGPQEPAQMLHRDAENWPAMCVSKEQPGWEEEQLTPPPYFQL